MDILAAVQRGVSFDRALDTSLAGLADPDRRLAHQLAAGVLRESGPLDQLLQRFVARGLASLSPAVHDVLRLGAYQLREMDRIPAHAAVATCVDLARERAGPRVAGFVNAVLRAIAALGELPTDLDVDDVARLAQRYTHPVWLVARWVARFGEVETERLLQRNNTPPPLVLQPTRGDLRDLEARFDANEVRNTAAPYGAGVIVPTTRPDRLPGFSDGAFFVQDPAQALITRFANFPAGTLVYDACAAPGGKAMALLRDHVAVIAGDRSVRRARRLAENLRRTGHAASVIVADATHPPLRTLTGLLLDAPCLGTGTFARHPDARLRVTEAALLELATLQQRLLQAAAAQIAPDGVLCYSTCSLEPEENEMQVDAFLRAHPDFRRAPPDDFPAELLTPAGDLQTLPHRDEIDGAYAARLVRAA